MSNYVLHQGDCLEVLRTMPDNSVDAIVTDPPYGLSFMGKRWDYDVPSVDVWAECLRVLKPGGHLLAFAGTRTQHRMAVRIEDAGFEIRDMIAWVYGSGFPKSLDVSKAIDRAAGKLAPEGRGFTVAGYSHNPDKLLHTAPSRGYVPPPPATPEAEQWKGWGTALKPALETVTFASKPYTDEQVRDIIQSNLLRLEARLWLLSSASAAEKSSTSSQNEYGAVCAIAQWSADEITNIRAALCVQMGTLQFELATTTSLNIVSSWRRTLEESWRDGSTCTTGTKSSTTIDWKTLKFSLSQITPESIIKACSLPGGFSVNATTAESHFNASLSLLQSIRTLSATERAMSQAQHEHQGAGVKPNLDPCIMARKPLDGTVAENVLQWGTGALNIDRCRVGDEDMSGQFDREWKQDGTFGNGKRASHGKTVPPGRWPANLIHDGSEEVVAAFPQAKGQQGAVTGNEPSSKTNAVYGQFNGRPATTPRADTGSAARFFYCAKASRADRNSGLGDEFEDKPLHWSSGDKNPGSFQSEGTNKASKNNHPTVKPTDLMRYLCRLVTPPGGTVLDPFMGSGSTGKAAMLEGFRFIGCELSPEYLEIAEARIADALAEIERACKVAAEDTSPQLSIFDVAAE